MYNPNVIRSNQRLSPDQIHYITKSMWTPARRTSHATPCLCQDTTLHPTAGLLLKLSRIGPGQFLDGRPDAAGSGVGGPVGSTLSSGLKKIPIPQGID